MHWTHWDKHCQYPNQPCSCEGAMEAREVHANESIYDPHIEQPPPVRREGADIQTLVMQDIAARREVGIERYGTALQSHNGRDALRDLYDELLDAACYCRQLIEERAQVNDS